MKLNNNDDSHNSGLNLLIYNMLLDIGVTPCVGVWIETCAICSMIAIKMSHPAWVCGLKLCVCQWYIP